MKGRFELNKLDFFNSLQNITPSMAVGEVIFNMTITLVLSLFIYWVYQKTYTGVMYSKSFNITIVLIALVTAMVMMVIQSNLALSLGMVGALSIIRFRSAIKDPKDIGYLFWGISVGLSAGTGSYVIALIGSMIVAMSVFVLSHYIFEDTAYILIIKGNKIDEKAVSNRVQKHVVKAKLRMKSINQLDTEIVYEIKMKDGQENQLIEAVKEIEHVAIVNILSNKGEIVG